MGVKNIKGDLQVNESSVVTEATIKDTKDELAALQALVSALKLSSMSGASATSDSLTQVCAINYVPYGHTYIGIFNIQATNSNGTPITFTQTIPIYVPTLAETELNGKSGWSTQYHMWHYQTGDSGTCYLTIECMSYREDLQACTVRCAGWNNESGYTVSKTKFTLL